MSHQNAKPTGPALRNRAAAYLGVWWRFKGDIDRAREYLRSFVAHSLDILSDNDPSNDVGAYETLMFALCAAGDYTKATAVATTLRLCWWRNVRPHIQRSHTDGMEEERELWVCAREHANSLANKYMSTCQSMMVCAVCSNFLCEACVDEIGRGNSAYHRICDSTHEWMRVPPVTEYQREILGLDQFDLEGEIVSLEEGVRTLRREWNIEGS